MGFVVGEVPPERVLLREGHPRMFPNLRRTHEHGNSSSINNSIFISSCLARFIETNSMATWEHIKMGGAPRA